MFKLNSSCKSNCAKSSLQNIIAEFEMNFMVLFDVSKQMTGIFDVLVSINSGISNLLNQTIEQCLICSTGYYTAHLQYQCLNKSCILALKNFSSGSVAVHLLCEQQFSLLHFICTIFSFCKVRQNKRNCKLKVNGRKACTFIYFSFSNKSAYKCKFFGYFSCIEVNEFCD